MTRAPAAYFSSFAVWDKSTMMVGRSTLLIKAGCDRTYTSMTAIIDEEEAIPIIITRKTDYITNSKVDNSAASP